MSSLRVSELRSATISSGAGAAESDDAIVERLFQHGGEKAAKHVTANGLGLVKLLED